MSYPPAVSDFKLQFVREFVYGPSPAAVMDADMQHPPALIDPMIEKWQAGFDIVYTQRQDEKKDISFFKRITSRFFYKLINIILSNF